MTKIKGGVPTTSVARGLDELTEGLKGAKRRSGDVSVREAAAALTSGGGEGALAAVKDRFERTLTSGGGCGGSYSTRRADPETLSKSELRSVFAALTAAKQKVAAADVEGKAGGGADGQLSPKEIIAAVVGEGDNLADDLARRAIAGAAASPVSIVDAADNGFALPSRISESYARVAGAVEALRGDDGSVDAKMLASAVKTTWGEDRLAQSLMDTLEKSFTETRWVTVGSGCTSSSERRSYPKETLTAADADKVLGALAEAAGKVESLADADGRISSASLLARAQRFENQRSLSSAFCGAGLRTSFEILDELVPRPPPRTSSYSAGC